MNTALKLSQAFEKPSQTEFQEIIEHVSSHHVSQNMHLRDTKQLNKKRMLRFLHMVKLISPNTIAGHVSGPDNLEMDYEITYANGKCQYTVKDYDGSEKELIRISQSLKKWLLNRVGSEKETSDPFANYKEGEFYLKRSKSGMDVSHPNIKAALAQKAFSKNFAMKVQPWGFQVIHP